MIKLLVIVVLIHLASCDLQCLNVEFTEHKSQPSPEELYACKDYSCNSCCTGETTKQIALQPLQIVGKWNFTQCEQVMSDACSMSFSQILCFFKCSPNIPSFFSASAKAYGTKIPLCSWFCNRWFETCQADKTCTRSQNWVTGFSLDTTNSSAVRTCSPGASCRNFSTVYENGRDMCDFLFGQVFEYSEDQKYCLDPFKIQHNIDVIKEKNPQAETVICSNIKSYTDAGTIVGIVFGVLVGLFVIALGVGFYLKRKQGGKEGNKQKETGGTTQELRSMTSPEAATSVQPANESDSDHE